MKNNSKTLYISDMDGTLLDGRAILSGYARDGLSRLIDAGLNFTVATARTAATAAVILKQLDMRLPAVLMNGVCVYDLAESKYLSVEGISARAAASLVETVQKYRLPAFLYAFANEDFRTYYERDDSPQTKDFIEKRTRFYNKVFYKTDDFRTLLKERIVYCSILGGFDQLMPAYTELSVDPDLHLDFYKDVYSPDYWYLEFSSATASKSRGVKYIREHLGFERVVGFGDNLNDLPLFEACDEAYAVANAKEELKARASGVILSNLEDGVVKWLEANAGL